MKSLANIKLRLSEALNSSHRQELSINMLTDVAGAIKHCSKISEMLLVSADHKVLKRADELGFTPVKEEAELGVNAAVALAGQYCLRRSFTASVVIPADLPLLSSRDLTSAIDLAKQKRCVVISPSRRIDGTNLLLRNPYDATQTDYEHDSFNSHWLLAIQAKCQVKIYISTAVQLDIDIPEDLKQFLRMGQGTNSHRYLKELISRGVLQP